MCCPASFREPVPTPLISDRNQSTYVPVFLGMWWDEWGPFHPPLGLSPTFFRAMRRRGHAVHIFPGALTVRSWRPLGARHHRERPVSQADYELSEKSSSRWSAHPQSPRTPVPDNHQGEEGRNRSTSAYRRARTFSRSGRSQSSTGRSSRPDRPVPSADLWPCLGTPRVARAGTTQDGYGRCMGLTRSACRHIHCTLRWQYPDAPGAWSSR